MQSLNILLADDALAIRQFVAAYLLDAGHRVTAVDSGEAAVDTYDHDTFDLVLMDLTMPGIGGIEAIRRIKTVQTTRWVPILVITALDDEADILEAFMAGADDYLVKPLRPLHLDIRIRSMMRIAALQQASESVLDNVIEGIIQIDRGGLIHRFNPAAEVIFGYTEAEVLGRNVSCLMPSPDREAHDQYLENYVRTRDAKIIGKGRKVLGLRKSGETFPMHLGVTEAHTPDGTFFIGLVRDITEEARLQAEIERLAREDALSGLPNRGELWRWLSERYAIARPGRGPADCSLLFCDLDGFKAVNDTYGHAAGDEVIRVLSARLRDTLFVRDFLARIGGDEFVVVIDGYCDDADLLGLAGRLIDAVVQPIDFQGQALRVGMSVGIAHAREFPSSPTDLLSAADAAMYVAKGAGKGFAHIAGRSAPVESDKIDDPRSTV